MDVQVEVIKVLNEVLNLKGRASSFGPATPLLGAVPELDSMAVVAVITTIEERLGIVVPDDEVDGSTFATVGSLVAFVRSRLTA